MKYIFFLLILLFAPFMMEAQTSFSYSLTIDAQTSGGVFDSTGALIRTLWSNKTEIAGFHSANWDGNTDAGISPTTGNGTFTFKVLRNNVIYNWDGLIGNTESAWTTTLNQWDGLAYSPWQLRPTFIGNVAFVAPGYSEGSNNLFAFNTVSPNSPYVINSNYVNQDISFVDADNDGSYIYLANSQQWSGENFITKFTSSGTPAGFTNGALITGGVYSWPNISMNGINIYSDNLNVPVAVAVQNTSNILAVSYSGKTGTSPVINFYDKTTGSVVGTPSTLTSAATSMGFTSAGLWYVSGGQLYLLANPSTSGVATQPITGLSNPIYVATNKSLNTIVVADGGTNQQVYEYNSSLVQTRAYGVAGGFNDMNPSITNNRLMLDNYPSKGTKTSTISNGLAGSWVKVDNNDGLWICDAGNGYRILHVDSSNTYVNQIQYGPEQYSLAVSQTLPTRVFKYGIEYAIDYTKPIFPGDPSAVGGNGSWRMVKNWTVGAEGANGSPSYTFDTTNGFNNVEQLGNGRVYGWLNVGGGHVEVELPTSGPLRYTSGGFYNNNLDYGPDGSWYNPSTSGTSPNKTFTVNKYTITGYSAAGDPQRSSSTYGTVAYNNSTQASQTGGWGSGSSLVPTTSGVIPMFQTPPSGTSNFPHLGGMLLGRAGSPLFEVYPEVCISRASFIGQFPCTNSFGGHNGQRAQSLGTSIFTAYDGQYALYGQTYCQWYQDGLLVGCYGLSQLRLTGGYNAPDDSGNISFEEWVPMGNDVYMYHTSESQLAPLHRWHISNLSSIYEMTSSGLIGSSLSLQ